MNTANHPYQNLMAGLFFVTGALSFMSGQITFSTLLFAAALLSSHPNIARPVRA
jgi:hypothetical protein